MYTKTKTISSLLPNYKKSFKEDSIKNDEKNLPVATLRWVPWFPVNPWVSRIWAKKL